MYTPHWCLVSRLVRGWWLSQLESRLAPDHLVGGRHVVQHPLPGGGGAGSGVMVGHLAVGGQWGRPRVLLPTQNIRLERNHKNQDKSVTWILPGVRGRRPGGGTSPRAGQGAHPPPGWTAWAGSPPRAGGRCPSRPWGQKMLISVCCVFHKTGRVFEK